MTRRPPIKQVTIAGKPAWQVYLGRVDGKRRVITRRSKHEVEVEVERFMRKAAAVGKDALRLPEAAMRDAAEALRVLDGAATLTEAARYFVDHGKGEAGPITVERLVEQYRADREASGRTPVTLRDIDHRLGKLVADFGSRDAHTLTAADLQTWISRHGRSHVTRDTLRRHLVGLLNFAQQRGHVARNVAARLTRYKTRTDSRPAVLSPAEVRMLMATARDLRPEIIPYLVFATFAGIRPTECTRLSWGDVDLTRGEVFVPATISKTGTDRYVTLQPNAVAWLVPFRDRTGPVHWSRRDFDAVRRAAGMTWHHDCLRHSFGSYHLAAFRNAGDTAEQMGHRGSTAMLFQHYRRAVREEDAAAFWAIRPDAPAARPPIPLEAGAAGS